MCSYDVRVVQLPSQLAAVVRRPVRADEIATFLESGFCQVLTACARDHVPVAGPPFARYQVTGDGFLVEAGFPVARPLPQAGEVETAQLPGGAIAEVLHVGGYDQVGKAYEAASAWLAHNGYVPSGMPWESYLDPPEVPEPRTLVHVPCERVE